MLNKKFTKLLLISLTLIAGKLIGQVNRAELKIKEQFDDFFNGTMSPALFNNDLLHYEPNLTYDQTQAYGTDMWTGNVGDALQSLITMYEVTRDKGYLIKFMEYTSRIQNSRFDVLHNNLRNNASYNNSIFATSGNIYNGYPNEPIFVDFVGDDKHFHPNGFITLPMAQFVHLVLIKEPTLQNFSLIDVDGANLVHIPSYKGTTNGYFSTIGAYANWLKDRVTETTDFILSNYWMQPTFIHNVPFLIAPMTLGTFADGINPNPNRGNTLLNYSSDPFKDPEMSVPEIINKQSGMAATIIYLSAILPTSGYPTKNTTLRNRYKGDWYKWDGNCLASGMSFIYTYPYTMLAQTPIFYKNADDSYNWVDKGWNIYRPSGGANIFNPNPDCITLASEDLSHAFATLHYPMAWYDVFGSSDPNGFIEADMISFRKTFTNKIYNSVLDNFNCVVDGSNTYNNGYINIVGNIGDLNSVILPYMYFSRFDPSGGLSAEKVYDILMNKVADNSSPSFALNIDYITGTNGSSANFIGISEFVKAQWQRECVNLTLKNRILNFNQDFNVKNKLIVDPSEMEHLRNTHQSFFSSVEFDHPIIQPYIEQKFVIQTGVSCNMQAGEDITFLPGFEVKAGAEFHASINASSPCLNGQRVAYQGEASEDSTNNTQNNTGALNADSLSYNATNDTNIQNSNVSDGKGNANAEARTTSNTAAAQNEKNETINKDLITDFSIQPNPGNGEFGLYISGNNSSVLIKVTNMLGQLIYQTHSLESFVKLNLSEERRGTYFVSLQSTSGISTKKLMLVD